MRSTIRMRPLYQMCLVGAVALLGAEVGGGCGPAEETPRPEEPPVSGLSNAEVATVAQVINETEIELGTTAVERATDELVRRLAQRIVDQHIRARMELGQLLGELTIQPITHELGDQVRTEATRERARLDIEPAGGAFDRAFIDGQLQLLNSYLRLLNNRLVQSATIPEYRRVLEQLRDDVNDRFNEALRIRDSGAVPH